MRLPNRLGCEDGVALVVVRVGGLAWELFKLGKREVIAGEWEVVERGRGMADRGGGGEKEGGSEAEKKIVQEELDQKTMAIFGRA